MVAVALAAVPAVRRPSIGGRGSIAILGGCAGSVCSATGGPVGTGVTIFAVGPISAAAVAFGVVVTGFAACLRGCFAVAQILLETTAGIVKTFELVLGFIA